MFSLCCYLICLIEESKIGFGGGICFARAYITLATHGTAWEMSAGWFNIVGLFALTAGSGFLTAGLVEDIWNTAVNCNLTNADDFLIYSRE